MTRPYSRQFNLILGLTTMALMLTCTSASATVVLYTNGFETDTVDWNNATRVTSGTNGITSASGGYHAEVTPGAIGSPSSNTISDWGGANYGAGIGVPTAFQEYWTSIDIYLNVGGSWANDTRFDFDSSINDSTGNFMRDFIFNAGYYSDGTGPGANTNRFVISASNNSQRGSAYAKNPDRDPIAISLTGWYTFEHHFYDDGGKLAVDMSIYNSSHSLVKTWSSDVDTKPIGAGELITTVGGNRRAWFDTSEFSTLAFDNPQLAVVPEASAVVFGGLVCGAASVVQLARKKFRRR